MVVLKDFFHFHPENFWIIFTHFDDHIFQRGWFNHQLDTLWGNAIYFEVIFFEISWKTTIFLEYIPRWPIVVGVEFESTSQVGEGFKGRKLRDL